MSDRIRVILVDDHELVRAGFRSLIEDNPDMEVTAEASNGKEAVRKVMNMKPDVVVLDISMEGTDGLELITKLKEIHSKVKIIILSMHEREYFVVQALEQGADGYVTKSCAPEDLPKSIRKVYKGGRFLSEKAYELLAFRVTLNSSVSDPLDKLSSREKQILIGIAKGLTVNKIAENYSISFKTVNTYRARIMEKLDLKNNVEIAMFALRNGLIEL